MTSPRSTISNPIVPFVKSHCRDKATPVIVQLLPQLVRGGVERGTLEMAQAIIDAGGRAIVVSGGGPMVRHLQRIGRRSCGAFLTADRTIALLAEALQRRSWGGAQGTTLQAPALSWRDNPLLL